MKTVNVACAIIERSGLVLIARRLYGKQKGFWEFPGGKIEAGESGKEAVKRELLEEMELPIEVREELGIVDHDYEDFHLHMTCYICALQSEEMHLHDHSGIRWITAYDEDAELLPADEKVLKMYKAHVARRFAVQWNQNREEIRMEILSHLQQYIGKELIMDLNYYDCECSFVLNWNTNYDEKGNPKGGKGILSIDCRPFNEYSLITSMELEANEKNELSKITPGAHLYENEVDPIDFDKVWTKQDLKSAEEFLYNVTTLD